MPRCGVLTPKVTGFITNAADAPITSVPWHVAIYAKRDQGFTYICGGTIVSPRLVVSAAHCFWDTNDFKDKSLYQVAVGKYYSAYAAKEALPPQFFNITEIKPHVGYQDYDGNYNLDIVLLALSGNIILKNHVLPVCIDKSLQGEEKSVPSGWKGLIVGWGRTEVGKNSATLRMTKAETLHRDDCLKMVPIPSRTFVTGDKFCSGDLKRGIVACQGDSGGGFVRSKNINGQDYYFLIGVVSSGGQDISGCNMNELVRFTNVHYYDDMIIDIEQRYPIE